MKFRLKAIGKGELVAFAEPGATGNGGTIALTPSRATSQVAHPLAREDDQCLWVALDEHDQVIGFAGSIPGADVHNGDRMGWNSCWWVDQEKGREAAMPLLVAFIRHWNERVAFSDMTERTQAIIGALRLCHTRKETLVQAYFRIPVHRLPLIARHLAGPANALQNRRLSRRSGIPDNLNIRETTSLDADERDFLEMHCRNDFSRRSVEEFNWAMSFPWLVEDTPGNRQVAERYPFSYIAGEFRTRWVVTRFKDEPTSLMLVSVRDGVLKVLYYYGPEPLHAVRGLRHMVAKDRDVFALLFAHPALIRQRRKVLKTALFARNRDRYVGVSKKILKEFPEEMVMQLGDGDALFT